MSFFIAVSGKGGVGKTTISALLVRGLISRGHRPVLAVDADPNSCLDAALGVSVEETVGRVREQAREAAGTGMAVGISKQELLELKISESLVEADDFDLIAMGRSEGPGCYCYANNVLKSVLAQISSQYPYVVLDNEAGLENLSRRLVQKVNLLVIVTDPSKRGLETVQRLHELAAEMGINYDHLGIIINRLRRDAPESEVAELKDKTRADFVSYLPDDDELAGVGEAGESLFELSAANSVLEGVDSFLNKVFA